MFYLKNTFQRPIFLFIIIFIFFSNNILFGQKEVKKILTDLQKGVLVVRLPSSSKKIKTLQTMLADPNFGKRQRSQVTKELANTERYVKDMGQNIITAVRQKYTFSAYTFVYDTAITALMKNPSTTIFYDATGAIDTKTKLTTDQSFFLLKYGKLTNTAGFIIADHENKDFDQNWTTSISLDERRIYRGLLFAADVGVSIDDVPALKKVVRAIALLNDNLTKKTP